MSIFDLTARPNADLFFKKGDSNDVRLGETILVAPEAYEQADVVLVGLPQDEGVRRNGGRVGAAKAPDAIRRYLYKLVSLPALNLFDLGNTLVEGDLEQIHERHQQIIQTLIADGKTVVVLGGGNDTSYADCSGLAMAIQKPILAFNVDAHFDVRADQLRNSGTPYRQLVEEKYLLPENFYEVAYQPFANSATYHDYCVEQGITTYDLHHVQQVGIAALLKTVIRSHRPEVIFWGLDMDVVTAAYAPGVSAVNPSGLSANEFTRIGAVAGSFQQSRIFEITEVNPTYDIDDRTCRLAAATIWYFLNASMRNNPDAN